MLSSRTSQTLLLGLLSLAPSVVTAQSACGLAGYSSCTDTSGGRTTGYGCCPTGWECFATECSQTATPTSTAPTTTKTDCPGVPAHHLCPESLGGMSHSLTLSLHLSSFLFSLLTRLVNGNQATAATTPTHATRRTAHSASSRGRSAYSRRS